mmetsp:Transcript_15567/g.30721  ORF Transcript_15567/g.30721 Transcript_15567/m.30721 type:complete len:207 (+) Transcript_15567:1805-2425(+)
MRRAITLWRGLRGPGSRIMSGSLKRLYRKSSTSSRDSGPPRFRKRIPTLSLSLVMEEEGGKGRGACLLGNSEVWMSANSDELTERGLGVTGRERSVLRGVLVEVGRRTAWGRNAAAGHARPTMRPRARRGAPEAGMVGHRERERRAQTGVWGGHTAQTPPCASPRLPHFRARRWIVGKSSALLSRPAADAVILWCAERQRSLAAKR